MSPNPGDPGTDVAGSHWALSSLWTRALPRTEDRCVEQKNHVDFHLDEESPDRLCHREWQKAPFLGPGGGARAELGVPGQNLGWSGEGKGAGSEALAPPLGYGWRAFGVILSLLDSLAAELPRAPPPCSVKLST